MSQEIREKRITPMRDYEARPFLNKWLFIGSKEVIRNGSMSVIVRGFGEKHVPRGGINHKHAGTYVDYTKIDAMAQATGERFWHTIAVNECSSCDARANYHAVSQIYLRVGDLPETPFWEGDTVQYCDNAQRPLSEWVVYGIDYDFEGGPLFHTWLKKDKVPFTSGANAQQAEKFTLVSRGNLWKMEHGEPMDFPGGIEEEGLFYKSLGMSDKVGKINSLTFSPENGSVLEKNSSHFDWDFASAVEALRSGKADQMKPKDQKKMTFVLIKYDVPKVPDFSVRMRAHELKRLGFGEEQEFFA